MKYFAYGSNLLIERLRERVPSVEVVANGTLNGHLLKFHKHSMDGSGKCDIDQTNDDEDKVLGVVFEIDESEKYNLDCAEGLGYGYDEKVVSISLTGNGGVVEATTYYATNIDEQLKPYNWYKDFVLYGAMQHNFSDEYVLMIKNVESISDENVERSEVNRRILEPML